jgi:hypothetical protein
MAKHVTLKSGIVFQKLRAAKNHFCKIRETTLLGTPLSEPERSDLLDIYRRYCDATPGWQAEDAVDVTTQLDNRQRSKGTYAPTKAFAVVTASGSTIFSVDKALEAIATSLLRPKYQ